jgi:acyl-CoA synthetase (AMP-forming)/AMP-acid ligase II
MQTAEVVAYHAAERPGAIALAIEGREIAYAALDRDIGSFARALATEGVARGNLVAVGADDTYLHCLLLIALEALGAASASFLRQETESARALLARADLVLAEPHFPVEGARRHLRLTGEWLQRAWTLPESDPPAPPPAGAADAVRILRTSGTTGAMKMLVLPRRQHEGRLQRYAAQYQFTETSRYLMTMPLTVGHVYGSAMACLRCGGRLVVEPPRRMSPVMALATHGITDVTLMPVQLKHVLDALPADFPKPSRLTVCSFGAPISASLRQRALERLATIVYNDYGCNEAGLIFLTRSGDDSGAGSIWPGVEVEIVDESDRPVPKGEVGRIRVRTEVMVDGYLDDPEATRSKFKEGWFYPGDSGVLRGARHLQVLGRTDELLNIGGAKLAPADLEHLVAGRAGVRDVGVCSIRNLDGFEEVCVCVTTDGVGDETLEARVLAALRNIQLGRILILKLGAVPRNDAGKIQRDRLRRLAEDAMRGTARRT